MNFKINLRASSKAIDNRQKKMGTTEIQKLEYLKNKKSFVDGIKSMKIVDISFKLTLGQQNS